MTRFRLVPLVSGLLLLLASGSVTRADTKDESLDFQEIFQLIKTHVAGVSDAELNRAAVQGLLSALGTKVLLVTNEAAAASSENGTLLSRAGLFQGNVAYLRIAHVGGGLAEVVSNTFQDLNATNKLAGLVLDLRYADGSDYAAAAKSADLFLAKAQPLLDWGQGAESSHDKTNAIQVPVAILVNGETAGAAEALAAMLRFTGAGLILGGNTAGKAMTMKDFPLRNGEHLRIATAPVVLGNGTTLSADGIKPDIDVMVRLEDERAYYADAFYVSSKTNSTVGPANLLASQEEGTNGSRRIRLNEAELVREHREGGVRDRGDALFRVAGETPRAGGPGPETPVVNDPALARALDLLKGLAVVRQSRS